MVMKKIFVLILILICVSIDAHEVVVEDSVEESKVPQISLEKCDSLMARDITDHYGVVYKDGKCGIYDLVKRENVTRIEYSHLWYAYRKEFEGEYFTYFSWEEPETLGVVGVAESNNQFIAISMPKKRDDE